MKMNSYRDLIYFLPLFFLIPSLGLMSCTNPEIKKLDEKSSEIKNVYVPDSRTDIYNVKIEKESRKGIIVRGETTQPDAKRALIEAIGNAGYSIVDSLDILPMASLGNGNRGVVSVSVANIRVKPVHSAELSTQAVMGTPVEILKEERGWLMIRTPDRYIGWTNDSSVRIMSESDFQSWNSQDRIIYTGIYGMVTAEDGTPVSDLVAGSILVAEETGIQHHRVRLPDGRIGYTQNIHWYDFEAWADTVVPREGAIVDCALQFIGIPYMWGGTSSKAFDCSGFTKTVYFLNGMIFERDASQQVKHGLVLSPDSSFSHHLPGDLLFFGTRDPYRIIHTGIWKGENQVIHASGMVKVESIVDNGEHFSSYLADTYIESRRIIGQPHNAGYTRIKDHPWYVNR